MNPRIAAFVVLIAALNGGCAGVTNRSSERTSRVLTAPATPDYVRGRPVTLNDNGAWCWFQGERAIISNGTVIAGSIANAAGVDGANRGGNVELATWDLKTDAVERAVLHEHFEGDDHAAPALYVRRDGRLLVVYGTHTTDRLQRWRIGDRPGDVCTFGPEQTFDVGDRYSYQNIFRLSAANGRLYNFHRGVGFNPNYTVSDDDGATWRYGGRLITWPKPTPADPKFTGLDGGRPYARYASDGVDTVHVLLTEDHPRAYDNSLYHGYIRGGEIYQSDGTPVAPLSKTTAGGVSPTELTRIFEGGPNAVAWCSDIRLDASGRPVVAFSVRMNDAAARRDWTLGGEDLRYWYARFDGQRWHAHEIAYGGRRLYSPEVDYSGLVTLHPYEPNTVYISTDANPARGTPLVSRADGQRHHEIFRGRTADGGTHWVWTPITANSTRDNLRPIVPPGDPKSSVLLWFRGTYRTYTDYATEVVGTVDDLSDRLPH